MNPFKLQDLAQAFFHEAGDGMLLFDPDTGRLMAVNPVAVRLTGFSEEELLHMEASYLFRAEAKSSRVGTAHR